MGLLLSVLVVCVGVLEVLACVRHFQDGYLPLWTPHCALTSGYTASYERWRKKPSDSCEFRSFDDVNGTLYAAEKEVSENCLAVYSNIQNGITGKQDEKEKAGENICPIDLHYQQLKICSGNGLSPSIDDPRKEVLSCHNVTDILASSLEPDEGEQKFINKSITNVITSESIPNVPEHYRNTKEALTAEFSADLPSENSPVNICTQYRALIPNNQSESAEPLSDHELERIFSHNNGTEKYYIRDEEIDIENEVPVSNVCDESFTSPCGVISEGNCERDSSDLIPGGTKPTQNEIGSRLEDLEIPASVLCGENALDTILRDTAFSAVVKPDSHVSASITELNISVSDSIVEINSNTVAEHGRVPSMQIESVVPSSDSLVDNCISSVLKLEDQIQHASSEVHIASHLQTHEDKCAMDFVEREPLSTSGEVFDKLDGTFSNSRNESVNSSHLNNEHRSQNSFVPHLPSEDTFITPSKVSSQYNARISIDGLESDHTGACEPPVSSPESLGPRKELPDWNFETGSGICVSTEFAKQLSTGVREETEVLDSKWDDSCSGHDTEMGSGVQHSPLVSEGENTRNITFEERRINETSVGLDEVGTGTKHAALDPSISREPFSRDIQNEKIIRLTNEDAEEHVSESCLDSQTILSDSVVSRNEGTPHDIYFPASGDFKQDIVHGESSNLLISSNISAPPPAINSASLPPLSISTSLETRVPVPPLPTDHQTSVSPPKVPSTPKRSKADISWPVFFPGTPVIKRPSVSFATPESVFTNDEFLRHCAEEFCDRQGVKIPDDNSTADVSESTESTSEGRLLASVATSEGSDSLEEPDPIVYREKSPSNIASGNDFSRKELKLQRRKSYKQKRYNSAVEIRTRDEEAEERSFSENNPGLIRASSVREPKKRYKQPVKSSSFEDALLPDIKTDEVGEECLTNTTENTSAVSLPEDRETEREGTQLDQENFEETKETSDITHCLTISTERNESKSDESKKQQEEKWIEGNATGGQKEDSRGDDDEENSYGEEQSSSQQKSPPKEAFWLIFSGEYTKAMSKDWHSGHFCCWQCDESLTGQRYVLRDDHPYCIKCYESVFANVCEECNKTIGIDSKDLSYKDKHWHEACFLCNKCRVSLVDKQFGSKADKIYCGNCYDAQFASRCDGCGEIFRAGTKKMEYKTRQWHEKCFCCCVCKTAIGTKSFIPREQEIYCATCYEEKFATRCVKCNKIITSGGVTYKNEPWHRECFTCTHCNTSLAGQRFTSRDEKPYCADCFGELFAKRCTACSKPITGIGGTRFISFEDRHWHNDCFICASCKTSLVGRGFITDADDIICPECAKQKLM